MFLLALRPLTRPLELQEEHPALGKEEEPVRPAPPAAEIELEVGQALGAGVARQRPFNGGFLDEPVQ